MQISAQKIRSNSKKRVGIGANRDGALCLHAWAAELPLDDPKRDYILNGIKDGFHVINNTYDGANVWQRNYKSATEPAIRPVVEKQILDELDNGRYIIVNNKPRIISALGAIPKDNDSSLFQSSKCRTI